MTEAHKVGRELMKRAAINSKGVAWLDKKLDVKQVHNFTGGYIEKAIYTDNKVTVYDIQGKEIEKVILREEKVKTSRKLSDTSDGKSDRDI